MIRTAWWWSTSLWQRPLLLLSSTSCSYSNSRWYVASSPPSPSPSSPSPSSSSSSASSSENNRLLLLARFAPHARTIPATTTATPTITTTNVKPPVANEEEKNDETKKKKEIAAEKEEKKNIASSRGGRGEGNETDSVVALRALLRRIQDRLSHQQQQQQRQQPQPQHKQQHVQEQQPQHKQQHMQEKQLQQQEISIPNLVPPPPSSSSSSSPRSEIEKNDDACRLTAEMYAAQTSTTARAQTEENTLDAEMYHPLWNLNAAAVEHLCMLHSVPFRKGSEASAVDELGRQLLFKFLSLPALPPGKFSLFAELYNVLISAQAISLVSARYSKSVVRAVMQAFVIQTWHIDDSELQHMTPKATRKKLLAMLEETTRSSLVDDKSVGIPSQGESHANEIMQAINDLSTPPSWFPAARTMKRKFVYHMGPTNSGKTYQALQRLQQAKRGIYCSPLRLLAREIYEKLTSQGIVCDLITGQECIRLENATHIACTVELSLNCLEGRYEDFEVAVVDEIQHIGNVYRGWAWTATVLGLPVKEIHLCGEGTALHLIRQLVHDTGDSLEVRKYSRRTPLKMSQTFLPSLREIRRGDCLVCFSRTAVEKYRMYLSSQLGLRCCVIYGRLPYETRAEQAKLFNDSTQLQPFDVLIATDAIGLGLNFNIRRIVFATLSQFDGKKLRTIQPATIRQIAGRAGRSGTAYEVGEVTCLQPPDYVLVREAITNPVHEPIKQAGIQPSMQRIDRTAEYFPTLSLTQFLHVLKKKASIDANRYFLCSIEEENIVTLLDTIADLSLRDKFVLTQSPADEKSATSLLCLCMYAYNIAQKNLSPLLTPAFDSTLQTMLTTRTSLEQYIHDLELYLWLSFRFDGFFEQLQAQTSRTKAVIALNELLEKQVSDSSSLQNLV